MRRRIWKFERNKSSFHDSIRFSWWASMNLNLLFIAERWRMVDGYVRWEWWMRIFGKNGKHWTRMVGGRPVGTKHEWEVELVTQCNSKFRIHLWEFIRSLKEKPWWSLEDNPEGIQTKWMNLKLWFRELEFWTLPVLRRSGLDWWFSSPEHFWILKWRNRS